MDCATAGRRQRRGTGRQFEGRQNNNCANANVSDISVTGSEVDSECLNTDRSNDKRSVTATGGARAEGGAGGAVFVGQQNTSPS